MTYFQKFKWDLILTHFPKLESIQRSQDSNSARFLNIPIKFQLFSKDRKIHISRSSLIQT